MRDTRGITLIALIITIIVLLILAGVTIAALSGENGILVRAGEGEEETQYVTAEEKVKLAIMASYNEEANLDKNMLKENLNNIKGINPKVEDISFNLIVFVDNYKFIITELGEVKGRVDSIAG